MECKACGYQNEPGKYDEDGRIFAEIVVKPLSVSNIQCDIRHAVFTQVGSSHNHSLHGCGAASEYILTLYACPSCGTIRIKA